ncbi:MFS transporter [Actibacterium sp. 188UL27-1]|uniref:MFS transporter n=1 Tax=Actibacterium sp. 188UL27-1 TaxID=2786961 RepID=UPI001957C703|nr:MFS transporter [Actibacterium sp. 188UL27-1]MBM7069734.1 MFS transporter [Actibacterium sp. 188UL27-1]
MLVLPHNRTSIALVGLYLAQAVPLYLVAAALPPILRAGGIGLDVIGGMGLLLAPWVLKAAWAPWIDRLSHSARVGRKTVIATCLLITVGGILALSQLDPLEDAATFFPILMAMSLSSATQDIASDGWAVEHLPPDLQPGGNALQGSSVAIGVLIGGSGTLILHDLIGWALTLWILSSVTILLITPFFLLPEAANRRPLPRDAGRAGFDSFLSIDGALAMLAFALLFRLPEGLVKALEQPFLVDQGFSLAQIGAISGGSAAAVGLIGAFIGAILISRWGLLWFLIFLICGRTLAFGAFYLAATQGFAQWTLVGLSIFDTFLRYIEIVGLYTAFMRFASLRQAGTDFTLLTSMTLLMYMIGSMIAGLMAEHMGYGAVFLIATLLSGVTGWMALTLLPARIRSVPLAKQSEILP